MKYSNTIPNLEQFLKGMIQLWKVTGHSLGACLQFTCDMQVEARLYSLFFDSSCLEAG